MKNTYIQFLEMIKCGLYKEDVGFTNEEVVNWNEILSLGNIHNVIPLIYESVYKSGVFESLDKNIINYVKYKSKKMIYGQIQRSDRFLQLYQKFNEAGLKVLVFKGIVLRDMYPMPDERMSGDEDMLIEISEVNKCIEILEENELNRVFDKEEEDADVYHYLCPKTGLHLELHTSLFGKNTSAYSHMNTIFSQVFNDSDTVNINGVNINTFSVDKHFLYIICHAIKHFVSCGTGIRQICDICMYINKYHQQINWNYIWTEITQLGYDTLLVNFLQIGIDYLGLDENKIIYQKPKNTYHINIENLIEDIMEGGVYGASTQARLNAANMSLDALKGESESKVKSNLAAIFPDADSLKKRYNYLEKYPALLPVAWISRIYTYIKERGSLSNVKNTAKETVAVGNKRIDLLKEYKLINK